MNDTKIEKKFNNDIDWQINELNNQLKTVEVQSSYYTMLTKLDGLYRLYIKRDKSGDIDKAVDRAIEITKSATKSNLVPLTPRKQEQALIMIRSAYMFLGSQGLFHYFLLAMEFDRPIKERFYQPRQRVLAPIVQDLQDLFDRKLEFLVIEMPPRTGKTTLGLLFLAMCIGHNYNRSSLGISYASSVAESFYDGVMEFITDEVYNFKDIFPKAQVVQTDSKGMALDLGDPRRYKSLTFRSIDGQITGGVEANDILYLDDLIQNIEEAKNKDRLNKAWDKVVVDIFQRRKPEQGCVTLAIGTNWSIDDPLTRLIELNKDNPKAKVHKMPALDELDESNFNYDYGVGFSTSYYRELRRNMEANDPASWSCIYQQEPMERVDITINRDMLQRYYDLPEDEPDYVFAYTDCAFGGGDYLVTPICAVYGEEKYIIDFIYDNRDYKITEPRVVEKLMKHNVTSVTFEANNGGEFYANDIARLLKDKKYYCNVKSKKAPSTMSKYDRIEYYIPDILNLYFKADETIELNPEYRKALSALCSFSLKGNPKTQKDDVPDALAGLCSKFKEPPKRKAKVYKRADVPFL